ncbi:hypothetical protein [Duganella vulcania]|uniref:Uncharacterized protein n=1 Tax=Duganella vulcania TaxID=2692166 RepID=A0A845GJ63_9BURK|nr:hypothetical protein [Duganella vulcania]MYM93376.1 hypothetical protein [Duganella vulcania]
MKPISQYASALRHMPQVRSARLFDQIEADAPDLRQVRRQRSPGCFAIVHGNLLQVVIVLYIVILDQSEY